MVEHWSGRLLGCLLGIAAGVLPGAAQDFKAQDFKQAIKDARGVPEKALAIRLAGDLPAKDPEMVPALARFLQPTASDTHLLLPVAAIDALATFRGDRGASQALTLALEVHKKLPYLHRRVLAALGRVGHESAIPLLEEHLKGNDRELALSALRAASLMPPGKALELLFRAHDQIEKEKNENVGDLRRTVIDALAPEVYAAVKAISGEPWTSMKEMQVWWQKRGAAFRAKAAEKEKESLRPAAPDPKRPLAPVLLVEFHFSENGGVTTANSGASSAWFPRASLTPAGPSWSTGTLDWGPVPSPFAVDLPGALEPLRNLKSFTLMGRLNCTAPAEGPGGNRILTWLAPGRDGAELVWRSDGSLQLGVNQPAHESPARSTTGQVPPLAAKAPPEALAGNWRFFAVTYDSTAPSRHVKFYSAAGGVDAKLDLEQDCGRGAAGSRIAPAFTIGNMGPAARPAAWDRMFRGLIDGIRVFGSAIDGAGALPAAEIVAWQKR
jgi:hypothetical protein